MEDGFLSPRLRAAPAEPQNPSPEFRWGLAFDKGWPESAQSRQLPLVCGGSHAGTAQDSTSHLPRNAHRPGPSIHRPFMPVLTLKLPDGSGTAYRAWPRCQVLCTELRIVKGKRGKGEKGKRVNPPREEGNGKGQQGVPTFPIQSTWIETKQQIFWIQFSDDRPPLSADVDCTRLL